MANQFQTRQWYLDTPYTYASVPNGHPAKYNAKIESISYNGYSVATNPVIFQDMNGDIVWQCTGTTDGTPVYSPKIGWVEGLAMVTKNDATGVCQVYMPTK